jgi:hypothetical protein
VGPQTVADDGRAVFTAAAAAVPKRALVRDVALVSVAGAIAAAAFASKAVHVDDPLYLSIAHQIVTDPILPFSAPINWQQITEPTWNVMLSPPGYSYWLATWMALGLTSHLGLHLVGAAWTIVLALATYTWARRLGSWPVGATLLVVASPFIVAGQNLMLDVPMLALATSAIAVYLSACDRNSQGLALLAGVLAGLAVNVKYSGIVAVAVMAIDSIAWRRRRMLIAGATGLMLFLAGQAASTVVYGTPQVLHARDWMGSQWPSHWSDVLHRLSSSILYLGAGVAWLALLCGPVVQRSRMAGIRIGVALAGATAAIVDLRHVETHVDTTALVHAAVFAFSGWLAVVWVATELIRVRTIREARQDTAAEPDALMSTRDVAMLIVWTVGFWYLGAMSGPFVAPRSVVPCLLSLGLLVQGLGTRTARPGCVARGAALALTVAVGLAVGVADLEWANVYREWAPRLVAKYRPARGTMYFLGHWGWQHYAGAAGMAQFDPLLTRLIPGDVLVFPRNVDYPLPIADILRGCRLVASERVAASRWLPRTRDPVGLIFLYGDTRGGRMPWGWSPRSGPLEEFLIFRFDG